MAVTQANLDLIINATQASQLRKTTMADASGTLAAASTSQLAVAANAARQFLLIQNVSAADLWINETVAAVLAQPSIKIAAGASLVFDGTFCPTGAINIIGGTISQAYVVKQG